MLGFPPVAKSRQAPQTSRPGSRALSLQSCMQEVVEELADGFGYSISLDRGQLHCTTINNQGCSEVRVGTEGSYHPGP